MALTTAQFAAQSAALIAAHVAGTIAAGAFETQYATLLAQWGVSNPALAQQISEFAAIPAQVTAHLSGPADGGFHADGTPTTGPGDPLAGFYPLANVGGAVSYVPSPAKTAATTAKGNTGATGGQGLQGVQGGVGPIGATGATPQVAIGNVTTAAPGGVAAANLRGTAAAPILDLTLPQAKTPLLTTSYGATRFSPPAAGPSVTLPISVAVGDLIDLDLNGQRQWEGLDFTTSGAVVTFTGGGVQTSDVITFRKLAVGAAS